MGVIKLEEPINWQPTIENIRKVRQKFPAPVDSMGCAKINERKDINQRFQVLVSLMLSSQTQDPVTWAAVQRLKKKNLCNVNAIVEAKEKDIEDLIHPVGFYRRKAVYLKKVAQILQKDYDCDIPNSLKELCDLPGVGPKMAHLCMLEAWNTVTGIGVDTHVHRIANRLGWTGPKGTKTPEDTRKALESWLPRDYWQEINLMLVGFGQTICKPVRPKCPECYNNVICPSSSVKKGPQASVSDDKPQPKKKTRVPVSVSVKVEVETDGYRDETKMGNGNVGEEEAKVKVKKEMIEEEVEEKKVTVKVEANNNEDTRPRVRASTRVTRSKR